MSEINNQLDKSIEDQLDQLMKVQNDHWEKYQKLLPESDDIELIVLKGHLMIEETLYRLAVEHCPNPKYLDSAQLSFSQLLFVVRSLIEFPGEEDVWAAIKLLNKLRNKLSHNLEPQNLNILTDEIDRLCKSEEQPKNDTDAKRIKGSICYILGYFSVLSTFSAFFERNKTINLKNNTQQ